MDFESEKGGVGSISAAFTTTSLQLFQVTFARGADNTIPWNREHLYSHLD